MIDSCSIFVSLWLEKLILIHINVKVPILNKYNLHHSVSEMMTTLGGSTDFPLLLKIFSHVVLRLRCLQIHGVSSK